MDNNRFSTIDLSKCTTPCYLIDRESLEENCRTINTIRQRTQCRVLLALKAFAVYKTFPYIQKYLDGVCASSLNEARLGREEFCKEVHTFSPAYTESVFDTILCYSDYVVFNSFNQWERFRSPAALRKKCGLRINPNYSEISVELYDPCSKYSRLGIPVEQFRGKNLSGISGLHFHAMCEQNADTLQRILAVVEKQFSSVLHDMEWVNFGGGHHISRSNYDRDLLCELVSVFQDKYNVRVYLEPGEAVALNAGILVATVCDIVENEMAIAVLDVSAETHMPDVLAMPYRPEVIGAEMPGTLPYTYRLAGPSCLAGDRIGDYSFSQPLSVGSRILFYDMAHYTIVKNTVFNGIELPSIALYHNDKKEIEILRHFGYADYKSRQS